MVFEFEYVLNDEHNFAFNSYEYVIRLGGKEIIYNYFTDDEIIEFISDCLTHEHIHKVIFDLFNNDTSCKLFDVVQQHFRNTKLANKFNKYSNRTSWDDCIKRHGFKFFLHQYGINNEYQLKESFDVCNKR